MPEIKKVELSPSVSIIVAGIIIAAAIVYTNLNPGPAPLEAANNKAEANVPLPSTEDHIVGSPTAPIVLVEYSDFQCPYCQMIYPTLKQLVSESNGEVAWVMRSFPLYSIHPQAMPAAEAAECIAAQLGNSGFWKFADSIFADQSGLSESRYRALAVQFGANATQYDSCIAAHTYQSKIQGEIADAQLSGGTGTPFTVIINTKTGKQYPVSGALPYAQFKSLVEASK